jgi:hypothetical protein
LNPAPLIDWVPTVAQAGQHTFTARVTDANGNATTTSFQVDVVHVNKAPQLGPQASLTMAVGPAFARTLTASDPDAGDSATAQVYAAASGGFAPGLMDQARVFSHLLTARDHALWHFFFAPNPKSCIAGRISTRLRGLNNSLTKAKGVIVSMNKAGLLAEREAHEKSLLAWIDADLKRKADYSDVLPALNALVADRARTRERDALLTEILATWARSWAPRRRSIGFRSRDRRSMRTATRCSKSETGAACARRRIGSSAAWTSRPTACS